MAIDVRCGHCGKSYSVPDALLGKWVKCGQCKQSLIVVAADGAAADAVAVGRFVSPPPPPPPPPSAVPVAAPVYDAAPFAAGGHLPPPPPPPPVAPAQPASGGGNLEGFVDGFFD